MTGLVGAARGPHETAGCRGWPRRRPCRPTFVGALVRCDQEVLRASPGGLVLRRTRTRRTKATSSRPRPTSARPQIRTPERYCSSSRNRRDPVPHKRPTACSITSCGTISGICKKAVYGQPSPVAALTRPGDERAGHVFRPSAPTARRPPCDGGPPRSAHSATGMVRPIPPLCAPIGVEFGSRAG